MSEDPLAENGKIKSRNVALIWEGDFDELVTRTYGRPYNYQQQGEFAGQDTIWPFSVPEPREDWESDEDGDFVPFEEWKNADPSPRANERDYQRDLRWEREYYPCFADVVNDLHERGLIDAGSYYMHVWW